MSALYAVVAQPGLCHHVGEYVGVDDKVSMIVARLVLILGEHKRLRSREFLRRIVFRARS